MDRIVPTYIAIGAEDLGEEPPALDPNRIARPAKGIPRKKRVVRRAKEAAEKRHAARRPNRAGSRRSGDELPRGFVNESTSAKRKKGSRRPGDLGGRR